MISYSKNAEIIEIIVRDFSGAKIESWRFNCQDKVKSENVLRLLRDKYGFSPSIQPHEHIDSVMGWLRKAD
jgi:hypothetical protein